MIHPSRHRAALLPARRGMRAAWLRCRIPDALAEADAPGVAPEPADRGARDVPEPAARPGSGPASPAATDPGPVRPTFGHPTF